MSRDTYEPLNTLKAVGQDLWVVDGPLIRFGPRALSMPFPTRMTVIRLGDSELFIHSPTALSPELAEELECWAGHPRWIVGPSRLHYWWIPEWHSAYPQAEVYLAPRIREQSAGRINFSAHQLDYECGYPWDGEITTLPITGGFLTEIVFFHHRTRTLVLTDLIENFEPGRISSRLMLGRRCRGMRHCSNSGDCRRAMPAGTLTPRRRLQVWLLATTIRLCSR